MDEDNFTLEENQLEDYVYIQELGFGHLGAVKEYEYTPTSQRVAIKTKTWKDYTLSYEGKLLKQLDYPFFPKFIDEWEHNHTVYLAMSVIRGIELFDIINDHILKYKRDALAIFKKIVQHTLYLHNNNIIHRDLKPENILISCPVSCDSDVYIVDFEMAINITNLAIYKIAGTKGYTPPEMFDDGLIGTYTDVWALGVILYILFAHTHPFSSMYCHWTEVDYRGLPNDIESILKNGIFVDYRKRMSCKEILEYPFFD